MVLGIVQEFRFPPLHQPPLGGHEWPEQLQIAVGKLLLDNIKIDVCYQTHAENALANLHSSF